MDKRSLQRAARRVGVLGTVAATTALLAAQGAAPPSEAAAPATARLASSTTSCPWVSSTAPVAQRVADVMRAMSLTDEITLVEGQGTTQPYVFYMAGIPRLCIPAMGLEDGPNGVGDGLTGVTQLPAGVSLAATFDPSLSYAYGQVVGAEQAGKGSAVDLGPTVNIDRDPRWGRSFETLTEDPTLNSRIAVPEIDGIQSQDVMAQVKHYVAYNQETNRNTPADDVIVSQKALQEIYLPAFQAAVSQADVASVMCAYSSINGEYACQDPQLLNTVLKQDWGFPGFVTSDYGALHSTTGALDGTDMEQPENTFFGNALADAVQSGAVPRAVLNSMIQRILTEMFRFNFFRQPPSGSTASTVTTAAHQAVANQVAEAGTVLLRNTGNVLPLAKQNGGDVAVIGPAASASPTYGGGGSARVVPSSTVTPLAGVTAAAGQGTSVTYTQGLPTDTSLPAIPSSALTPGFTTLPYGGSYQGTLTAPETGTYVLAVNNPCGCYAPTTVSINGQPVIVDPGTPPVSTYSAPVSLTQGQTYTVTVSGAASSLTWAPPSALAPGIAQAVAAAKAAATAVVVVSDDTETEAADRPALNLPSAQDELISAVAAANPHTVVVIDAGAPVAMPWLDSVASVVDAWYPGQTSGTALADVLYGTTDPSGHLPVTFPASLAQVPASGAAQFPGTNGQVLYSEGVDVGYRWYDATNQTPLFPFGFGLSYTTFRYSNLQVSRSAVQGSDDEVVTAQVTNTGQRAGADVAQVYLGDPAASGEPPRQLEGFTKVTLNPGQSATVSFTLTPQERSAYDQASGGWTESTGAYRVYVGDSSALGNLPLRGAFTVSTSPGTRQLVVAGPSTAQRGQPFDVTVTLPAGGDETLRSVALNLASAQGWSVRPLTRTTFNGVAPGTPVSATFEVTAPAGQPVMVGTLQATAGAGDVQWQTGISVQTR